MQQFLFYVKSPACSKHPNSSCCCVIRQSFAERAKRITESRAVLDGDNHTAVCKCLFYIALAPVNRIGEYDRRNGLSRPAHRYNYFKFSVRSGPSAQVPLVTLFSAHFSRGRVIRPRCVPKPARNLLGNSVLDEIQILHPIFIALQMVLNFEIRVDNGRIL